MEVPLPGGHVDAVVRGRMAEKLEEGRVSYAVVLGEALVDLLESECEGQPVFRRATGGAPLNVAVGVARLGGRSEFAGALGDDRLGDGVVEFLTAAGVGTAALVRVAAPTTLAVATFAGAEPEFRFYGEPPSYALIRPDDLDPALLAGAGVLYCGSIFLLREPALTTARHAWASTGGLRVFDPNVRPTMLPDAAALDRLRSIVEEFAARADLVKVSAADAAVLYGGADAADRFLALGARAVVVTNGAQGARVAHGEERIDLAAPRVNAVDATGAGDSVMAALVAELLRAGPPGDAEGWVARTRFALHVAGLVCESPGGAVSMPTRAAVAARFPELAVA